MLANQKHIFTFLNKPYKVTQAAAYFCLFITTEEAIVFFVTFLSSVAFQFGGARAPCPPPPPPGFAYVFRIGQFIYNYLRASNVVGIKIKNR